MMEVLRILVLAAVMLTCKGQGLDSCTNLASDLSQCTSEFLSSSSEVSGLFSDVSKVLNTQTLYGSALTTICSDGVRTNVREFYTCMFEKIFSCVSEEWRKVFPEVKDILKSFDYLCDNINDNDLATAFSTCVQNNLPNAANINSPDTYLSYVCSAHDVFDKCYPSAYGSCQKSTAMIIADAYQLLKPAACCSCGLRASIITVALVLLRYMFA